MCYVFQQKRAVKFGSEDEPQLFLAYSYFMGNCSYKKKRVCGKNVVRNGFQLLDCLSSVLICSRFGSYQATKILT